MGMTLWIHTLEGREMSKDSDDHSLMHRLQEELDALGLERGVGKFSEFFDYTDMNYSMDDEFGDEFDEGEDDGDDDDDSDEEPELDPETGYGYGIDDMQWFDASAGLKTLRSLREAVAQGALGDLADEQRADLLEELDDCTKRLEAPAERGGRFHLAVVM
jgi:hypothetical protein